MGPLNPIRSAGLVALLALSTTVCPASAEPVSPEGAEAVSATCNLTAHRRYAVTWSPVLHIPDNDPNGITTPPLYIPNDGSALRDVAVEMFVGFDHYSDLVITASYDVQCDGTPEASVYLVNRACLSHALFACANSYMFSDRALAGLLCRRPELAGCFWPTSWSIAEPALYAFNGLPTGGCFTLQASDNALYYTGYLCGLAVYTNGTLPVPTLVPSWGALKLFYR